MRNKPERRNTKQSTNILNKLKQIEKVIENAMLDHEDIDYDTLSRAVRDFEDRVDWLLKVNENLMSIVQILNDTYYFPMNVDIEEYIRQTYSTKIPTSKSRQAIAKKAALIIVEHKGEEKLRNDLPSLREAAKSRLGKKQIADIRTMELDEIKRELQNSSKYPNIESLRIALKGVIPSRKLHQLQSRESIIEAVLQTIERTRSVRVFSKR
jgi:hypothetical protein